MGVAGIGIDRDQICLGPAGTYFFWAGRPKGEHAMSRLGQALESDIIFTVGVIVLGLVPIVMALLFFP